MKRDENAPRAPSGGANERRKRAGPERDDSAVPDHERVRDEGAPSDPTAALASGRPSWELFRAALEDVGFRPSRRFGQNFLLDENMLRAIVRAAGIEPGARVVEIGSGCGFLSLHLVRAGAELTSVEIDARLLEVARRLLANERPVTWIHCDALAGKHALNADLAAAIPISEPWHLVSNLPYSIAAPLLVLLARHGSPPTSMTVLVQREVAERIVAKPGEPEWGPLSIRLQTDYDCELVRAAPASLFWPRPKVESMVLRLDRRSDAVPARERTSLDRLIDALFQRRRQALGRVLSELLGDRPRAERVLSETGLDAKMRGEDLDLPTLRALRRALDAGEE